MLRFFSMPWWAFFICAGLSVAAGVWMKGDIENDAFELAEAQRLGPPELVDVEVLKAAEEANTGPSKEINIRAQLDSTLNYRLSLMDGSREKSYGHMMALYPVSATDTSQPPIALLIEKNSDFNVEVILGTISGFGDVGPIVSLNGQLDSLGDLSKVAKNAFEEKNRTYPSQAFIINPFMTPRADELAAQAKRKLNPNSSLTLFALIGLGLAAIGFVKLLLKRRREEKYAAFVAQQMMQDPEIKAQMEAAVQRR